MCFLFIFCSFKVSAAPKKVEFIFLTEETSVSLLKLIESNVIFSKMFAENNLGDFNCVPMGDAGCFHPQYGYIENKKKEKKVEKFKENKNLKTFNSSDVNLVDCKEGNYFDIFCGKSTKEKNKLADVEVWVDTSSSMRKMDYSKGLKNCHRHRLLKKVQVGCAGKAYFSTFDTGIKNISDLSMACVNYGLNDTKRTIDWIKRSNAKHLFIITDIDEMNKELSHFIDTTGAKTHGLSVKKFLSKDLLEFSQNIIKTCSKK